MQKVYSHSERHSTAGASISIEILDYGENPTTDDLDIGDQSYMREDEKPRYLLEVDDGHLRYWFASLETAQTLADDRIEEWRIDNGIKE